MLLADRYAYQTNRFLGEHMEEIALNSPAAARVCAIPFGLAVGTLVPFFAQMELTEKIAKKVLGYPSSPNEQTLLSATVRAICSPVVGVAGGLFCGTIIMINPLRGIKHINAMNELTAFSLQRTYPEFSTDDENRGLIVNQNSFVFFAGCNVVAKIWNAKSNEEVKKLHFFKTLKDFQNLEREIWVKDFLVKAQLTAYEKKEISLEKFTCTQKEIAQKLMSEADIIEVERQMQHRITTPLDPIHMYRALRAR